MQKNFTLSVLNIIQPKEVRRLRKDITQLLKASTTTLINAMGATIFVYSLSLKLLETTGSALGYGVNIFIGPIVGLICSPL